MTRNNTTTLDRALRGRLENAVKEARETAEAAARAALEHLCAGGSSPPPHLSEHERGLRRRLRAHGRQLGDARDPIAETQEINCLIEEAAYEHWHRMLFTRFLAENNLLIYPDPENPVSVTLEECGEMAQEEGAANGWELASRFASQMLPQIFRLDSPVFQLALPPEFQQKLERLIAELPAEVFTASDSLGWVYQFWQSKRKDEVNKSEVKIGAKELPAVTQLFTEPYMVSFLLDNSIGAWWATRRLSPDDLRNALSEDELRNKASVAGVPLEYIRFVKQDNGSWRPAAGDFENWPENPGELKILDPCCGSGHFLISALLMLVPMRMQIEGLSARNAVDAVLRENLHGLEIDRRCVEIAAFNLALAAWRYPGAGGYRNLPELNIACSGLAVSARKEEWMSLAGDDIALRGSLSKLHDMFRDAPILGSLINPHKIVSELFVADYAKTAEILKRAVGREQSDESKEAGIAAQGIAKAASLLADKYHLIITNVPYLARGKQCAGLSAFCEKNHYEAKGDLATVFLDRCLDFCVNDNGCQGTLSLVLPQNWLFLTTYKRFRERLLRDERWRMVARLGEGGFESTAAAGAFTILLLMSLESESYYKRISEKSAQPRLLSGLDASAPRIPAEKAELLRTGEIKLLEQERQLDNPDARVVLEEGERYELLEKYASAYQGISPADFPRFGRFFWENIILSPYWSFWQSSVENIVHYGGKELIIWLSEVNKKVETEGTAYIRGSETWGKKSIVG
ncbi:MAG: SAM-dependent DNA methyltransferase, partial [Deltaproteobacteria bacterium]|nr:SAM-dependent DNA methyltransferase [Deltaproteobacteria bacterium]